MMRLSFQISIPPKMLALLVLCASLLLAGFRA
jgi:hypothetical protein